MVSIIIPARNEVYLEKTIRSILTAARGKIEVIAILDGYTPDPQIDMKDKRVTFLHYPESIGQRPAINAGVKRAKGKYILKTDAHSMFDEGFDVKLAADCEYDWTVIPRMYNLDVEKWEPKLSKITDYMLIRSPYTDKKPFRHYYWDGKCKKEHPKEYKIHRAKIKNSPDIDDVMTGQGACWFMHKDRFLELGGLDEAHGQWGQMGVEIALKAWLSGGRHVVNKKTWFSHWFRGGGGPGFPWPASGKAQEKARKYSIDFWTNSRWPLQKRPLSWLIEKFAPVPTWNGERWKDKKLPKKLIKKITYTDTRNPKPWTQAFTRLQCKNPVGIVKPATIRPPGARASIPWFAMSRNFKVKSTYKNIVRYAAPDKVDGMQWVGETIDPFIERIVAGEAFTDKQLKQLSYFDYLVSRLNPLVHPPEGPNSKGVRHCIKKMKDLINLVHDMKANGMKAPLDFYIHSIIKDEQGRKRARLIFTRGTRRLRIAHFLGWDSLVGRIWKTKHLSERFIPTADWPDDEGTITNLAAKQFAKYGNKSTDKYYKHSYTYIYDRKFTELKRVGNIKILELGVRYGASTKLWQDAFPKAEVYGVDEKLRVLKQYRSSKMHLIEGDYRDTKFLKNMAEENGPFNLIIDDCDHVPEFQKAAFETLWPYVISKENHGGIYVIEDFYHNYDERHKNNNMLSTVKGFIDKLYLTNEIKEISFHPGVVIITKAK